MKTARQVAIEILTATEAGKTVQCRPADPYSKAFLDTDPTCWHVNDFEPSRYEWRVKPEPREVWINESQLSDSIKDSAGFECGVFRPLSVPVVHDGSWRKFREVLD